MKNYDYLTKAGKYTQNGFITKSEISAAKSSYYGCATLLGVISGVIAYIVILLK